MEHSLPSSESKFKSHRRLKNLLVATMVFSTSFDSVALAAEACLRHQQEIDQIADTYKAEFTDIEVEADQLASEAQSISDDTAENVANVDIDIVMREKRIVFDTPSVTMQSKRIVVGVPQVTMRLKSIKFDIPKTRFVLKKTGQYPEFTCVDTWIKLPFGGKTKGVPKCTTKWSDIFTKIPEVYMETTEIKTKIPEVKWANTELFLKIPEFFMERQEWFLKIPEIKSVNLKSERKRIEKKGNELASKAENLQSEQLDETKNLTNELYQCHLSDLNSQKISALQTLDDSISEVESTIEEMKQLGIDPSSVPSPDGKVDLTKMRAQLESQKAQAIDQFNEAILELEQQRQSAGELI